MKSPVKRRVRNVAFLLLNHLLPVKRRVAMNLSGLSRQRLAAIGDESDRPHVA
jgi:hypothetical protein